MYAGVPTMSPSRVTPTVDADAWSHGRRLVHLRDTEVEDLERTLGRNFDVRGLQVAVDDAFLVCRVEALGDLAAGCERFRKRKRAACQSLSKRQARNQLEHETGKRTGRVRIREILEAVDLRNMRMVERSKELRFTFESRKAIGIGDDLVRQDLDGDLASEPRVARTIDLSHPAGTEQSLQFVSADPPTR